MLRVSFPASVRFVSLAVLLALLLTAAASAQQVAVPELSARVTDLTGTLSAEQRAELERALADFERRKGAQLAVLMVPSTGEETIEQYGIRVVDAWRLGRRDADDGLLLLVAKNDRTLRIEVGYGLEGAVPDAIANRVIDEIIVPRFRQGDYYGGIRAGLERLMGVVEGEPLPPPPSRQPQPSNEGLGLLPLIFFGYLFLSRLLTGLLGRLPGAAVTGVAIGALTWPLAGSVVLALAVGAVVFVFSLGGGRGIGGFGGWHGMRRGGGFGGGVFRGGGGGFGGGGASGRW